MAVTKKEFEQGDVYIRKMWFSEVGDEIPPHDHFFDHATIACTGKFRVRTDAGDHNLGPGDSIHVPAKDIHSITCLEPGVAMCVFAHRNQDGTKAPRMTGWENAYV